MTLFMERIITKQNKDARELRLISLYTSITNSVKSIFIYILYNVVLSKKKCLRVERKKKELIFFLY